MSNKNSQKLFHTILDKYSTALNIYLALNKVVEFRKGEKTHTETSRKYNDEIGRLYFERKFRIYTRN